jgi:hypothetical protein
MLTVKLSRPSTSKPHPFIPGFVLRLIHADMSVKWAITGCKGASGRAAVAVVRSLLLADPDFTADVRQVLPIRGADSETKVFSQSAFIVEVKSFIRLYFA